jgi:protocatechuate 4,5-dioxygenase alpha chain
MADPAEFSDVQFADIPGTVVFTASQCRKGFQLNQFCMSLTKADNRDRFKANEQEYLEEWPLTAAQREAVLSRDYNAAIAEGGNIYFLAKLISADGNTMQYAASRMTGMTLDDYRAMMASGGRSPHGWRSIKDGT